MIPVFIAPAYARFDLLERMLGSIDLPVGRGIVIDNSCTGQAKRAMARVGCGPEWRAFEPPFTSLGLAGSINAGITQTADAPWWLWASDDVVFSPGDLDAISSLIESHGDQPVLVTYRFAVLALNRSVIERVGLFDEWSFHPLYFDDTDMARRCRLAGIPILYDKWGITEGVEGVKHSTTVLTNHDLAAANNRSWAMNQAAYVAKWGGLPGKETYDTPWDLGLPLWATRPDLKGRAERSW